MALSTLAFIVLLTGACLLALALYIALLSRHRKAGAGQPGLLGMIARVETDLEPEGAIMVSGELWRARLSSVASTVARGRAVRIIGVSGHLLLVEPTDQRAFD